jgi:hypothetical protein
MESQLSDLQRAHDKVKDRLAQLSNKVRLSVGSGGRCKIRSCPNQAWSRALLEGLTSPSEKILISMCQPPSAAVAGSCHRIFGPDLKGVDTGDRNHAHTHALNSSGKARPFWSRDYLLPHMILVQAHLAEHVVLVQAHIAED